VILLFDLVNNLLIGLEVVPWKFHMSKKAMIALAGLFSAGFSGFFAYRVLPEGFRNMGALLGGSTAAGGLTAWWVNQTYGEK
jgi:hypothetical protein